MTGVRITVLLCLAIGPIRAQTQDWTHYVRIGGYGGPTAANIDRIMENVAENSCVWHRNR